MRSLSLLVGSLGALMIGGTLHCGAAPNDGDPGSTEDALGHSAPTAMLNTNAEPVTILHFDEPPTATSFRDVGLGAATTCSPACPEAGGLGLFGSTNSGSHHHAVEFTSASPSQCLTLGVHPEHALTSQFSITSWIYLRALPAANTAEAIVAKYDSAATSHDYFFGIENKSGKTVAAFTRHAADGSSAQAISTTAFGSDDVNKWHFLAFTQTSHGVGTWYVDGRTAGTQTFPVAASLASKAELRVGCAGSEKATEFPFVGKIDEVVVYAKTALSAADIEARYTASAPTAPSFSYWGGASYSESTGEMDLAELSTRVATLHNDVYRWDFRRQYPESCYNADTTKRLRHCNDYASFETFLGENPNVDVIATRHPYWGTVDPTPEPPNSRACFGKYGTDYGAEWGCAMAQMSTAHPNLKGWLMDDFTASRTHGLTTESLSTPANLKTACAAAHDPAVGGNPKLTIGAVVYCGYDDAKFLAAYQDPTSGYASCIDNISLFRSPSVSAETDAEIDGEVGAWNQCIDNLRTLRKLNPSLTITGGIYVSSLSKTPQNLLQREQKIDIARRTNPDSFLFWLMPTASDTEAPFAEITKLTRPASRLAFTQW